MCTAPLSSFVLCVRHVRPNANRSCAAGGLQPERPRGPLSPRDGRLGHGEDSDATASRGRRGPREGRRAAGQHCGTSGRRPSGGGAGKAAGGLPRDPTGRAAPENRVPGRHRGRPGVLVSVRRPDRVSREDQRALRPGQVAGQVAVLARRVPDHRMRLHHKDLGRRHLPKAGDNRAHRETSRKSRVEPYRPHGRSVDHR